jgi:hypothetical protein
LNVSNEKGIIRTKMAAALMQAVVDCGKEGRNAGHVGRVIVTNAARGVGVKYAPRTKPVQKIAA